MHASDAEPRHRADTHEGHHVGHHEPRHEHEAGHAPQAERSVAVDDAAAPALSVRDVSLEYPDGTANDGTPRTVRALDHVSL